MIVLRRLLKIFVAFTTAFLLFFVIMYFTTRGDYQVMSTVENSEEATGTKIDGYLFHTQEFGDKSKPELIVVHGGPGYDFRYLLQLRGLANDYHVIFYDQRGSGLSPRVHPDELSIEQSLTDLTTISNHFSPDEKVHLIGHSWGALITAKFTVENQDRVEKLVLIEPEFLTGDAAKAYFEKVNYLRPEFSFSTLATMTKSWFQSLHIDEPDKQASPDFFMEQLMLSFEQPFHPLYNALCHNEDTLTFMNWRFGAMASGTLIGSLFDAQGNLVFPEIQNPEKLRTPVLFVTGECNELFGKDFQQQYHLNIFRNARLVEVQRAGHFMMTDNRKETIKVIRDFFGQESD